MSEQQITENLNSFIFLEYTAMPYSYNPSYLEELKSAVTQCRDDKNTSKFYLYRKMIEFAQVYNAFRPHTIDRDHPYYGTVKKMDSIYATLFRYLDIESDIYFSKWPDMSYSLPEKLEHDKVAWEKLIREIDAVHHSLIEAMGFSLFLQFGSQLPRLALHYFKEHIRTFDASLIDDEIAFDPNDQQIIIIRGERVRIEWRYQLSEFIRERRKI